MLAGVPVVVTIVLEEWVDYLAGEIRPVQSGQERLKEAEKHGFKRAIVPYANAPKQAKGIEVLAVKNIQDVLRYI